MILLFLKPKILWFPLYKMAACNLTVQTFGVHGLGDICAVAMAIPMEIIVIS